jgi:transcriptional regulator with XRE-family HTH domain
MGNSNYTVGKNLKNLREVSGFTQEQVAATVGIERSTYSNYEAGIREVPFENLEQLSKLFGCDLYLLFEDNASIQDDILACAFRIVDLSEKDLKELSHFKDVVSSYLKMIRIANA